MAKQTYRENVKDFGNRYLEETGKVIKMYSKGIDKILSRKVETKGLPKRAVEFVKDDGDEFLRDVVRAGSDYYFTMLRSGLELGNSFINSVLDPPEPRKSSRSRSSSK